MMSLENFVPRSIFRVIIYCHDLIFQAWILSQYRELLVPQYVTIQVTISSIRTPISQLYVQVSPESPTSHRPLHHALLKFSWNQKAIKIQHLDLFKFIAHSSLGKDTGGVVKTLPISQSLYGSGQWALCHWVMEKASDRSSVSREEVIFVGCWGDR